MSSVCRVCLAGNTTLHYLKNDQLVDVYERLSNTKFNAQDERPRVICHCCYRKLLRCHTFSQMTRRSEKIFSLLCDKGLEATHEHITQVNLGMIQHLPVDTIDGKTTNAGPQVTIKHEPIPSLDIKEEVTIEQDTLLEVQSVPEDGTESQLTIEGNSDGENDEKEVLPCNIYVEKIKPDDSNMFSCNDKDKIIHKQKKLFVCSVCDKPFNHKGNLVRHMRIHTGEKPPCNIYVEKIKPDDSNMFSCNDKDKIIHKQKKLFACSVCDKPFNHKGNLVRHMRIHTGEKPFTCSVCNKPFNDKGNIVKHMKIHTGQMPFACRVCDKPFIHKSNFVIHMRNHTGEKPFACNLCDKSFKRRNSLVIHMRIHTGEKPFACSMCDKQFIDKCHLNQHMRIHTGEKPFACSVCDKPFNDKSNLSQHMKIHTGKKPFSCSVCDKQFKHKVTLNNHMRIHTWT